MSHAKLDHGKLPRKPNLRKATLAGVRSVTIGVICALALSASPSSLAQTVSVVYAFPSPYDGVQYGPAAGPTFYQGTLYGTTYEGSNSRGDVYDLSKGELYSFCSLPDCADGAYPAAPVTFDNAGNIYGTTTQGGANNSGVIFELSPAAGGWTETVLCSFPPLNTYYINPSGLVIDGSGNLYGTWAEGVFELSPGSGGWTFQTIFDGGDNFNQYSGLTIDAEGNLYGVTSAAVFELSPNGSGGWISNILHTFPTLPKDGIGPISAPVFDLAGNLYGGTSSSGIGKSIIYKLTPGTKKWNQGKWKEEVVSVVPGHAPATGIILDASGNIYGTTTAGYFRPTSFQEGTVFVIKAPTAKGRGYKAENLYAFVGTNGMYPVGHLAMDNAGNVYGATYYGGPGYGDSCGGGGNCGTGVIFEIAP